MTEPIVYVEWVDSAGVDGWCPRTDLTETARLSRVRSAGLLVAEDDESITIVEGIDDTHGNVINALTIPRFAITQYRTTPAPD